MVTITAIVVIEAMTISGQRRLFNQTHCLQIIPRAPGMQLFKFSQMLGGPFADAAAFFFFFLSCPPSCTGMKVRSQIPGKKLCLQRPIEAVSVRAD